MGPQSYRKRGIIGNKKGTKNQKRSKRGWKGAEKGPEIGPKSGWKGEKSDRKTRGKGHKGGKYRGLKVVRKGSERLQMSRKMAAKYLCEILRK